MAALEQRSQTERPSFTDTSSIWKPSDVEPLHRILPEHSPLHEGVQTLDRVMFACSNTELKPALLLYGLDETPRGSYSIAKRLAPLRPDSWDSRLQPGNIVRMMHTFIIPPGFAQEPIERHFATTPQGETIAKDSAAFLLQRAISLGMPLGPVLQERTEEDSENPTRAYITRIATLIALKDGVLSQARLQERIGGDVTLLAWNLRVLSERGLISYDSADPEIKGQQIYERADLSKLPKKASILAKNILKYFELNEIGNHYAIAQALGRDDIHAIGKTLRQLMKAGVIKPTKWVWTDHQSEAKIMSAGEKLIDELVVPLLSAYVGDQYALQMLAKARVELERNPEIATAALDQYKRQRVLTPEPETHQAIVALIRENGPQRRRSILSHIGKMAHPQLIELVATGQLRTVRDGNASFYLLPESDEEPTCAEEIIIVDFNPPADLFDIQEHRKIDEYRREFDTLEFWQRVAKELQSVPRDRYTARDFFLKYDPQYKDWPQRWYSGIFSNYIRALWSLGIEHPEEFIRTYQPEGSSPELRETIATTQDLINKVFPKESKSRLFNRRYIDRLETPDFWSELVADAQSVPPGTKIESFMLRFDPTVEGKLKPGHQYGKYYPLRSMVRIHTGDTAVALLTAYRPPEGAPLDFLLTVRETQAALRKHLIVRNVPPDDFSDIEQLRRQQIEEIQKRKESQIRLLSFKSFFEQFQEFNDIEVGRLATLTAERVRSLRANIKGYDTDEASFASIGFETNKYDGSKLMADTFPAELRAAYLVFAFEQWRNGVNIPRIPTSADQQIFTNRAVKNVLTSLERYLTYSENQAKKNNPEATLPASILIDQLKKYVGMLT